MMMMDAQSMVPTLMEGAVAASVMRMTRAVRESLKEGYHPEEAKITRKLMKKTKKTSLIHRQGNLNSLMNIYV
jgi:hypothetical protein